MTLRVVFLQTLDRFEYAGRYDKKIKNYKFWRDGN